MKHPKESCSPLRVSWTASKPWRTCHCDVLFTAVRITTDDNRSCWNLLWARQTATDMGVPLLNLSAQCKGLKRQASTSPQFYLWFKKTFRVRHLYTIIYMIGYIRDFIYKNIWGVNYRPHSRGQKHLSRHLEKTMRLVKTRSHSFLASCSLLLRDFRNFVFNTSSGFVFTAFV